MAECKLKLANGLGVHDCDEETCVFWRVVDHVDGSAPHTGCAIQYYQLLGSQGSEMAAWLLSVKLRVEDGTTKAGG